MCAQSKFLVVTVSEPTALARRLFHFWLRRIETHALGPFPASQAGQGNHRLFRHHSVLRRYVDPRSLGSLLCIRPVQVPGMRVASSSGSHLCRRLQHLQSGALDEEVAVRHQQGRDRSFKRVRTPEVPQKVSDHSDARRLGNAPKYLKGGRVSVVGSQSRMHTTCTRLC